MRQKRSLLGRLRTRLSGAPQDEGRADLARVPAVVKELVSEGAVVGIANPPSSEWVAAVEKEASAAGRVVTVPPQRTGAAHAVVTAREGPFDVIVDRPTRAGRRTRFNDLFFHLRPGGSYIVPDGAEELDDVESPGLGAILEQAAETPDVPLREIDDLSVRDMQLAAVKQHVTVRRVGAHVVLTHDLDDVYVKMRDSEYNDVLEASDAEHRVLATIDPGTAPPPAPGVEGPGPQNPPMHRPITEAELSLRDYRDVVVHPRQVITDGRLLLPDTYRHNLWSQLRHKVLADLSTGTAVFREPPQDTAERLGGTWLHLDNEARGHFGHLLTETVSRLWTWDEAVRIDPDVRVLVSGTPLRPNIQRYERDFYEAAGIPVDRITLINEPVRVERLISGSPMFVNPMFVHPRIADKWREVGDRLAEQAQPRDWPRRLFIGRKTNKRACLNSDEVEALFLHHGFEIVFPEDHRLADQVQMFRGAEVVAGYAGSGLFQAAFVPEPTRIIQIRPTSYRPRNEYLIAAAIGHRFDSVVAPNAGRSLRQRFRVDMEHEGAMIRRLLEELPDPR